MPHPYIQQQLHAQQALQARKAALVARLHRGLRPKLDSAQLRDLSLAHNANLDTMANGQGSEELLWQWVGGLLTWSRAAELLDLGAPEIVPQLDLADAVLDRYRRTGRIGFSGPEYQLAKKGVIVMDLLAAEVDSTTAIAAAEWSEACLQDLIHQLASTLPRRTEGRAA